MTFEEREKLWNNETIQSFLGYMKYSTGYDKEIIFHNLILLCDTDIKGEKDETD